MLCYKIIKPFIKYEHLKKTYYNVMYNIDCLVRFKY